MIAEAVEAAVNSETDKRTEDTRLQKKIEGQGTPTHEGAIMGDLIATMIAALQPVLVKSVTAAVTSAVASKQIMIDHDTFCRKCSIWGSAGGAVERMRHGKS